MQSDDVDVQQTDAAFLHPLLHASHPVVVDFPQARQHAAVLDARRAVEIENLPLGLRGEAMTDSDSGTCRKRVCRRHLQGCCIGPVHPLPCPRRFCAWNQGIPAGQLLCCGGRQSNGGST